MDAYVRSGIYGGNPYGAQDPNSLMVKGTGTQDDYARESFLKFDLTSAGQLTSAALILKKMSDVALNFDVAIVYDDSWQEGSISWNNKPGSGSVVGHVGADGVAILDMGILSSIASDKTISLKLVDNSNSNVLMTFYSREAGSSNAPRLRITDIPQQGGDGTGQGTSSSSSSSNTSSDSGSSTPNSTSSPDTTDSGTNPINGDSNDMKATDNASTLIKFSWGLIICAVSFMLWM